jgi:GNAT superfamily N-acetyltransferase
MTDVAIVPLTNDHWEPLAELFGEGGDPRWCWCMFWRRSAKDGQGRTVREQREALQALAAEPLAPGLVALRDGRAVGWTSLGPREGFQRIERSRVIPRVDDTPVWAVVCFVVSRSARGEGLTSRLLDAAVEWARAQGATALEGYPVDVRPEDGAPASSLYTGTLPAFLRAGFEIVAPTTSRAAGRPRVVVRRSLQPIEERQASPGS